MSATEFERYAYIWDRADGMQVFEESVGIATANYNSRILSLAVDDLVGQQEALDTYNYALRAANDEYDLTVGQSEIAFKAAETKALVVLKATILELSLSIKGRC